MRILTIGHGGRGLENFLSVLEHYEVTHLGDVRSTPASRFQPEFNQALIRQDLKRIGVKYVYLGDTLGGRPTDASVYDAEGHVIYAKVCNTDSYRLGIQRLMEAVEKLGRTVCLMCSERKPETCHRSKLIGETLVQNSILVEHIDEKDQLATHACIMQRLQTQPALFPIEHHSRGTYNV